MSNWSSDRWLERVWLVNGVVLLAALVIGAGFAVVNTVTEWHGNKDVAVAAPAPERVADPGIGIRAVRFDIPVSVRGSDTRLVLVHNGVDFLPKSAGSGLSKKDYAGYGEEGPTANVVFLPNGGAPGRLLFERPAYIKEVSYPGNESGHADSLQTWISYEVVLEDSNGDGKLDDDDERQLMVSNLEGTHLVRVLPAGWRLKEYSVRDDHRTMVITALQLPKSGEQFEDRQVAERAFVYDVPTGKLAPLAALDSVVERAGRILAAHAAR